MDDGAADTSPLNPASLYAEYYEYTSSGRLAQRLYIRETLMRLGTTEAFRSCDIKTPPYDAEAKAIC